MEIETSRDLIHLKNKMRGCQTVEGILAVVDAYDTAQALEFKKEIEQLTAENTTLKDQKVEWDSARCTRDNYINKVHSQLQEWRTWASNLGAPTYLADPEDSVLRNLLDDQLKGYPFDEAMFDIDDPAARAAALEKPMLDLLGTNTTRAARLKALRGYRRALAGGYQKKVRQLKEGLEAAKAFPDAERKKFAGYIQSLESRIKEYEAEVDYLAKCLRDWQAWADAFLAEELVTDPERRDELDDILSKAQSEAATTRSNLELTIKCVQSWHAWADGFLGEQPVSDEERQASMDKLFRQWQRPKIDLKLSEEEKRVVQRAVENLESRAETTKAEGTDLNTVVEQDILDTYFPGVVAILERVWPEVVSPKSMDDAQLLKFLQNSERDSSYLLKRVVTALSARVEGGVNGQASHHP